jgi:hypothetical protein
MAWLLVNSRLESLPVGRRRTGEECSEITSAYVWCWGVNSGSSQSTKMEIPDRDRQSWSVCADPARIDSQAMQGV